MIKVHEIMTTKVVTLSPTDSLLKARELMAGKRIRHVPIINDSFKLVGLVTQRDILKASASCIDGNSTAIDESNIPVSSIMSEEVKHVFPDESLRAAGLIMQKYKYGCLPVIDDDKLVGIITDTDYVGVAINLIEQMDHHEELDYESEYYA